MTTADRLYRLLPAVHRLRDAAQGEPLKALIAVLAEQVEVLEEDLDQLYDDQFIETCAPWVAPYLGDLIGYRPLHGVAPRVSSPRAEIANTIGYRRRKGTAAMLEQVARDVTGWHACVVEFFQRLATTQNVNHVRRGNRTADLREWEPLERLDTPFDRLAHTVDVRRVAAGRGRYNLPNIGIFLWRLDSFGWTDARPRALDERRFWFSPLGVDEPLFTRPAPKADRAGLSTRLNVPDPIGRRTLANYANDYYGSDRSFLVIVEGAPVPVERLIGCDLSDTPNGSWAQHPRDRIGIDPVLGRIAFPRDEPPPADVRVNFHHGFSAALGGGEYDRTATIEETFTRAGVWQVGVSARRAPVAGELFATLQEAIEAWNAQPPGTVGVIAIMYSDTYREDLAIVLPDDSRLLIVAAEWPEAILSGIGHARVPGNFNAVGCRPHLRGNVAVRGAGGRGGHLVLNGLLVEGALDVAAEPLAGLALEHCTLVPGRGFSREGYPLAPREPSLVVASPTAVLQIDHSITGGVRLATESEATVTASIVDATSGCGVAFAAPDGFGPGGTLRIEASTVIGKIHTQWLELANNTIFSARLAAHDAWAAPLLSVRRQSGCVRFSFLPPGARTPRRYQCQPRDEEDRPRVTPRFSSLRYGEPGYAQLSVRSAPEIFRGADDESEMGAFHDLFEPQRIANIGVRLDEYLRFGLEAGLFFEPRLESRPLVPNAYTYTKWVDLCGGDAPDVLPGIGAGLI